MISNATGRDHGVAVAAIGLLLQIAACSGRSDLLDDRTAPEGGSTGAPSESDAGQGEGGASGRSARDAAVGQAGAGTGAAGASGADQPDPTGGPVYIKASNPDAQDSFGGAVALSEPWLAVGAAGESSWATGIDGDELDDSEDRSGAVYLFSNDGTRWSQQHYLKASNTGATDGFGDAIALSGRTLAVGARFEDSPATGIGGDEGNGAGGNHGAVYVFVEADGGWRQEAYVKASNTDPIDLFGTSVALEGDVLVVGAPWEDAAAPGGAVDPTDNSVENCGAVYVFGRTTNGWVQTAYLKVAGAQAGDEFGMAVAISGTTIAVGAPGESSSGTGVDPAPTDDADAAADSGAVYVFEREGDTYRQTAFLKASNTDADDAFGYTVALDADTLAVGATGEASSARSGAVAGNSLVESGAVYVFERDAGSWAQRAYLKALQPAANAYFGAALALGGDTLLVGALGEGEGPIPLSGGAYVFLRDDSGWQLEERMTAPNAGNGDRFGAALAVSPTLMVIGARNEASDSAGIDGDSANDRTPGAGAVFVYAR